MSLSIKRWMCATHKTAVDSGWWPGDADNSRLVAQAMMGMHAELSEAWECWREDDMSIRYGPDGKPEGFAIELADVLIRLLNFCEHFGIDIENAMKIKDEFNRTRPHRHGGKRA